MRSRQDLTAQTLTELQITKEAIYSIFSDIAKIFNESNIVFRRIQSSGERANRFSATQGTYGFSVVVIVSSYVSLAELSSVFHGSLSRDLETGFFLRDMHHDFEGKIEFRLVFSLNKRWYSTGFFAEVLRDNLADMLQLAESRKKAREMQQRLARTIALVSGSTTQPSLIPAMMHRFVDPCSQDLSVRRVILSPAPSVRQEAFCPRVNSNWDSLFRRRGVAQPMPLDPIALRQRPVL